MSQHCQRWIPLPYCVNTFTNALITLLLANSTHTHTRARARVYLTKMAGCQKGRNSHRAGHQRETNRRKRDRQRRITELQIQLLLLLLLRLFSDWSSQSCCQKLSFTFVNNFSSSWTWKQKACFFLSAVYSCHITPTSLVGIKSRGIRQNYAQTTHYRMVALTHATLGINEWQVAKSCDKKYH